MNSKFQYVQPAKSSQLQMQKKKSKKVNLAHKQLFANDFSGRLYGEIERFLKMNGSQLITRYQAYLMKPEVTKFECLQDIEGFLEVLSFYSEYSKRKRVPDHNFVCDPDSFNIWQSELFRLYNSKYINETEHNVLYHAINCCLEKRITSLPEHISESIMSKAATKEAANEVYKNRLDDVIAIQSKTHHLVARIKQMIEDAERSGIDISEFTIEPILIFKTEDLDYNHGKNNNQHQFIMKGEIL